MSVRSLREPFALSPRATMRNDRDDRRDAEVVLLEVRQRQEVGELR